MNTTIGATMVSSVANIVSGQMLLTYFDCSGQTPIRHMLALLNL